MNLKKRDLQIWKPLLSIAKLISDDLFLEILKFAEKISGQRREDFILEESFDHRILLILKEILDSEIQTIRPKEMKKIFIRKFGNENEKIPAEKRFSSRLDNLGFRELRQPKDRVGASFEITKEDFEVIVSPICPDLSYKHSSHSSHSSQSLINNKNSVMNDDKSPKNVTKNCDECDENDECDANIELKGNDSNEKIEVVKVPSAHDLKKKKDGEKTTK